MNKHFYQGSKLPHWQPPEGTFFITARLFGSIPKSVIDQIKAEYQLTLLEIQKADFTPENAADLLPEELISAVERIRRKKEYLAGKRYFGKFDAFLDSNRCLGRTGHFWEEESYDHWLREGEFERIVAYILNNPVKAGIVSNWQEYPWSYCNPLL